MVFLFIFVMLSTLKIKTMSTVKEITRMMKSYERVITWYNKKYNFNISLASPKEQKEYNSILNIWDSLKAKRDLLTAL